MPGYRSGFVAGDPEIVAALRSTGRTSASAPLEFVQRAAVAAWNDEAHVDRGARALPGQARSLLPALEAVGLRDAGGDATFFLWMDAGREADALAARWLEAGVVVAPGLVLRRRRKATSGSRSCRRPRMRARRRAPC